jgi:KDO2-lipid IV(A) lauroyltransferase
LSRFASLADAVVVPLVCRQLPRGRGYEVICRPPLVDFPSNDLLQDATTMNREIEQEVREAPHQYFWMHRRFKTRPPGEASLYG